MPGRLSNSYRLLTIGFLRNNYNHDKTQFTSNLMLISLIQKYFRFQHKRNLINLIKLYKYYQHKRHSISKYFSLSKWDGSINLVLLVCFKHRVKIQISPTRLNYSVKTDDQTSQIKHFGRNKLKGYPSNGETLRFKVQWNGHSNSSKYSLEIHVFDEGFIHYGSISFSIKCNLIVNTSCYLEWNGNDQYVGGYVKLLNNPNSTSNLQDHVTYWLIDA